MQCPQCGHTPPAESKFCNQCGHKLPPQEEGRGYTPPHLVEKVLRMRSALEGERKQVTVLFADVKGSVALSETLDPEVWHQVMDRFFAIVTAGIHDFEGTINQYTGDGIMALFGAPIAHEDHARRACLAALRIQRELHALADELQQEYGVEFLVRIGMNSGEVVVGRIGDDLRMDYTAQGHTVGLAARMESMARPGRIYLSHFTRALVEGMFELRERGDVRIRGVARRVKVYELRRSAKYRSRFEVAREQGLPPLIGRQTELQVLDEALEQARNGKGQIVAITGDPGIGKSRLLYEFAQRCNERDLVVAETRGVSYHKAVPAAPVAQFLKSYFHIDDNDTPEQTRDKVAGVLRNLDPKLEEQADQIMEFLGLAGSAGSTRGVETQLDNMQDTFLSIVAAASRVDSGVILLDNLHWLDSDVMHGLLDYMMQSIGRSHVMAIVTYRPEYACRWHDLPHFRELRLAPFDESEGRAYLDALLGEDENLLAFKLQIIERTGGNPLFMEQVVRSLVDTGQLVHGRSGYRLSKPLDQLEVPAEIQALVAARIDRLPDADKRLLQVASVIGKQFPVQLLQAVSGLSVDDISHGLERLTSGGWIYRCSIESGEGQVEYAFHQSLLREVAYLGQLAENRATIHRAVAENLVRTAGRRSDGYEALVAHHYAQAGELETAVMWYARAATWAAHRDLGMALQHWRAVSTLVDELPDSPKSAEVALQACSRLISLGSRYGMSMKELQPLIERGQQLSAAVEDQAQRCYFLIACGTTYLICGDGKSSAECYVQAVELVKNSQDTGMKAAVYMGQGHMFLILGELWQAESVIATGLSLLDGDVEAGNAFLGRSPYVSLLCLKAWLRLYQGRLREAEKLLDAARELAVRRDESEPIVLCDIVGSLLMADSGYPRKAIDMARSALQRAEHQHHTILRVTALWALGNAHVWANQGRRALEALQTAQQLVTEKQVALHMEPRLLVTLGRAQAMAGDADKARGTLREAVRISRRRGQKHLQAVADLTLAEFLLNTQSGRRVETEVLGLIKQAESMIDEIGVESLRPRWHMVAHQLAQARGDADRADVEWQSAADLFKQLGATAQLRRLRARLRKRAKE